MRKAREREKRTAETVELVSYFPWQVKLVPSNQQVSNVILESRASGIVVMTAAPRHIVANHFTSDRI